jgi:hypothetical protein
VDARAVGASRPARRVFIPKPGREELRPLSIPAVRDRVVRAAVKLVIEPGFEADFLPCSFGFGPKRSAHDALQVLIDQSWKGRRWALETDIANCFEAIPHSGLMSAIEERVSDRRLLKLLRAMLRAGVMRDGAVHRDGPRRRCWCRFGRPWPSWAYSSRRPRSGSCTCGREARGLISSASITVACAGSAATGTCGSSPAGPHERQCSEPAIGPSRMPPVKDVGEPCAGEPHARIDAAAGGNRNQSRPARAARNQAPPADPTV